MIHFLSENVYFVLKVFKVSAILNIKQHPRTHLRITQKSSVEYRS